MWWSDCVHHVLVSNRHRPSKSVCALTSMGIDIGTRQLMREDELTDPRVAGELPRLASAEVLDALGFALLRVGRFADEEIDSIDETIGLPAGPGVRAEGERVPVGIDPYGQRLYRVIGPREAPALAADFDRGTLVDHLPRERAGISADAQRTVHGTGRFGAIDRQLVAL